MYSHASKLPYRVALFESHIESSRRNNVFEYDVTSDGKRFLINTAASARPASAPRLTVVVNWNAPPK